MSAGETEDRSEALRRRYRVTGRVQGVGFRFFTCRTASALGLSGWVRNQPDGSVLCEAQGSAAALADLRDRLKKGPDWARVERVDCQDLEPVFPEASGFEIH